MVPSLQKIVQIYAFENMSVAVNERGVVSCWGENKNNQLLVEGGKKKFIEVPTKAFLPDYFLTDP